jgi:hypothetical protein
MKVAISSLQATSTSKSKGDFEVSTHEYYSYKHSALTGAVIPYAWELFPSDGMTNYFFFNEGGATLSFNISSRSYLTATDLETALKTGLDDEGGQTYTVTVNSGSGRLTISAAGNFVIEGTDMSERTRHILGIPNNDSTAATSFTGSYAVNLTPDKLIFIESNIIQPYFTHSSKHKRLPIIHDFAPLQLITYHDYDFRVHDTSSSLSSNMLSHISIRIIDIFGNVLVPSGDSQFLFVFW